MGSGHNGFLSKSTVQKRGKIKSDFTVEKPGKHYLCEVIEVIPHVDSII